MSKTLDVPVRVRLPAELLAALRQMGKREDRTVSWLVRQAVERYVTVDPLTWPTGLGGTEQEFVIDERRLPSQEE